MNEGMEHFQLSTTLYGHEKDVRCLAAFEGRGLISGSRDLTTRIWQPDESERNYKESLLLKTHKNFVSCVCILPADTQYPKGLILTGSNDCSIHAFDVGSVEPVFKLQGHTDTVSVLVAGKFGTFVSGSWDHSAKVWMKEKCIMTLTGHEAAVWGVGLMESVGYIVTGSADKTIKVWKGGHLEGTITGHTDCVRSIQTMPDNTFYSASNDSTIRHWNLEGTCLLQLQAHHNYIYTLALLNGGELLSGGEDGCVCVWREAVCVQNIPLPAISVWAVCVLNNGDVAVATSDGNIRIFTRNLDRIAPEEELAAYKETLAQSSMPEQVGDIRTEDLPGPSALLTPGKSEGQVLMVRGAKAVEAYQWSAHGAEWVKVGEVTGGVGGGKETKKKKIFKGKEYDYVFDVDIKEGQPCLQLPYNLSDDPYTAAHAFLDDNDISHDYLDQVANFIMSQVPASSAATTATNNLSDAYVDPYTGGTRYRGDGAEAAPKSIPKASTFKHFPEKTPLKFAVVNVVKMLEKLLEFNGKVGEGERLTGSEVALVEEALKGGDAGEVVVLPVLKTLKWPADFLLPALDSLRACLLSASFNKGLFGPHSTFDLVTYACKHLSLAEKNHKNLLVLLRCLTNAMLHDTGAQFILSNHQRLLERLPAVLHGDPAQQVALSSLLLNISIAFTKTTTTSTTTITIDKSPLINFISTSLPHLHDHEAFFRTMVALGTLLYNDPLATAIAVSIGLPVLIKSHPCHLSSPLPKVTASSTELLQLMNA